MAITPCMRDPGTGVGPVIATRDERERFRLFTDGRLAIPASTRLLYSAATRHGFRRMWLSAGGE